MNGIIHAIYNDNRTALNYPPECANLSTIGIFQKEIEIGNWNSNQEISNDDRKKFGYKICEDVRRDLWSGGREGGHTDGEDRADDVQEEDHPLPGRGAQVQQDPAGPLPAPHRGRDHHLHWSHDREPRRLSQQRSAQSV